MTRPVPDQRGEQARNDPAIFDAAKRQHFKSKHRACQGRAEHRAEARRDAGHQQDANTGCIETEQAGDGTGETAAELHGGSLASRRAAEQMRRDRAKEHQRCHAERYATPGLMDLLDNQIVAGFDRAPGVMIEKRDGCPAHGQEIQQPRMIEAGLCSGIEAP
jgi:hypothetical protein